MGENRLTGFSKTYMLLWHNDDALRQEFTSLFGTIGLEVLHVTSVEEVLDAIKRRKVGFVAVSEDEFYQTQTLLERESALTHHRIILVSLAVNTNERIEISERVIVTLDEPPAEVAERLHNVGGGYISSSHMRLLVVDDSELGRKTVSRLLKKYIIQHSLVSCGREAVEALTRSVEEDKLYDALLTDQVMPGMTGEELCQWVRSHESLSDLPAIGFPVT